MANKFKVGDIVKLKSGGPPMTVSEIFPGMVGVEGATYWCVWFSGFKSNRTNFPEDTLEPAEVMKP